MPWYCFFLFEWLSLFGPLFLIVGSCAAIVFSHGQLDPRI